MFRSLTIIRELAWNLAKVIFMLKHSVKLGRYLLCCCVAAFCHTSFLYGVSHPSSFFGSLPRLMWRSFESNCEVSDFRVNGICRTINKVCQAFVQFCPIEIQLRE